MTRRRLPPEQRRLEVIEAAEEVLRHNASARVEDIVVAAGAAKGTFDTYFPSWDDLLETIRDRETERTLQHVSPAFGLAQTGQWTAVLPTLAEGFIKAVLAMQGLHGALFHSPFTVARPLPKAQRPAARIAELLRAGTAAGAWQVTNPQATSVLVFAAIHQAADEIAAGASRKPILAAVDEMLHRVVTEPITERSRR